MGANLSIHPSFVASALVALLVLAVLPGTTGQSDGDQQTECPEVPVDVLYAIDVSGSMHDELGTEIDDVGPVKQAFPSMLSAMRDQFPDGRAGLATFSDYPGTFEYPDYKAQYGDDEDHPWALPEPLTHDDDAVNDDVQDLRWLNGLDTPEAYGRVLWEVDQLDTWRPDATRILVVIGDAFIHDQNFFNQSFGLDPGRDAAVGGGDDIHYNDTRFTPKKDDRQDVRRELVNGNVHALMVQVHNDHQSSDRATRADQMRSTEFFWDLANATHNGTEDEEPKPGMPGFTRLGDGAHLPDVIVDFTCRVLEPYHGRALAARVSGSLADPLPQETFVDTGEVRQDTTEALVDTCQVQDPPCVAVARSHVDVAGPRITATSSIAYANISLPSDTGDALLTLQGIESRATSHCGFAPEAGVQVASASLDGDPVPVPLGPIGEDTEVPVGDLATLRFNVQHELGDNGINVTAVQVETDLGTVEVSFAEAIVDTCGDG